MHRLIEIARLQDELRRKTVEYSVTHSLRSRKLAANIGIHVALLHRFLKSQKSLTSGVGLQRLVTKIGVQEIGARLQDLVAGITYSQWLGYTQLGEEAVRLTAELHERFRHCAATKQAFAARFKAHAPIIMAMLTMSAAGARSLRNPEIRSQITAMLESASRQGAANANSAPREEPAARTTIGDADIAAAQKKINEVCDSLDRFARITDHASRDRIRKALGDNVEDLYFAVRTFDSANPSRIRALMDAQRLAWKTVPRTAATTRRPR